MKTMLKPGAGPRAKTNEITTALDLISALKNPKASEKSLTALHEATLAHDAAREAAEATIAEAKKREEAAREAESAATHQRQALADSTATARAELGQRETAVAERERLAGECEKSQEVRDADLERREKHLASAGVRGF